MYATPIETGNIKFCVYPHAGHLSHEDWQARIRMVKAIPDCPTISVRTYFPNELIIRAVGSPAVDLPQPFLPEGSKSAAIAVTVKLPYDLIVARHGRLRVHTGLEAAYTQGCRLEVVPYNVDPYDSSSWEDMYVPGLKPIQRSLEMTSERPFTPVIFDLQNSYISDVQQNKSTPIAILILRPGPLVRKITSAGSASSSSTGAPFTAPV